MRNSLKAIKKLSDSYSKYHNFPETKEAHVIILFTIDLDLDLS